MFFSDKSEVESLGFHPRGHCFSLARVEWRNIILNGEVASHNPIVDLSDQDPTSLLYNLFGPLSFTELFELYWACQSRAPLKEVVDWTKLFSLQKMSWSERSKDLFISLKDCPSEFLDWTFQKQASAQDLMPLQSLKDFSIFNALSKSFSEKGLSRNEGKKVLDILVDLILMGKQVEQLSPTDNEDWFKTLYKLRNPTTYQHDSTKENGQTWPKYVQVQKVRQGDRLLKRMQITYSDSGDLSQKLNNLNQVDPK